jgi:serine/threonine protein kinase
MLQLGFVANRRRELPASFGTYVIERDEDGNPCELRHGAMGVTYRAVDTSLQRPVALKIVKADFAATGAEARERFVREARAAAALRHPNVATAYQFGINEDTGQSYYAMELVEGETLEQRVRRTGPMSVRQVVEIGRQITAALAAAEKRGLVHRDLKPANIMVVNDEKGNSLTVKVIDFGLAKALAETPDNRALTHANFVGTPAFASPEQLSCSHSVDVRSDIYSLGATLWYLLTGQMPFANAGAVASPPIDQLKAAHVPARFISLLVSMLATQPAARPSTAELQAQFERIWNRLGRGRARVLWTVVLLVTAAITVALSRNFHRVSLMPAIPEKSVAILPFTSFDKEDTYLADGLQDDILTDLAKVADLKVISRRSVEQYRGTKLSVRDIGRALQVAYVLEGTVRRVGDKIRVTEQLIDTRTETEKWGEK